MKKLIIAIAIILMSATWGITKDTQGYAPIVPAQQMMWVQDFAQEYVSFGIFPAVEQAINEGITPNEVMSNALMMGDINPMQLVAALYCASALPEDIRQAVQNEGMSEMMLVAGFEQAKTVCGDEITDTQAYTPVGAAFAGVPGGGGGGRTYGSPSGFPQ